MKDFRRQNGQEGGFDRREQSNDFRGPRRDFDNRGGFNKFKGNRDGGSSRGEVMHKAVCSECHKPCEVPFIPNGNKPVYCNDCFSKKRAGESHGFEKKDFAPRAPSHHESQQPQNASRDVRIDDIKTQINHINSKLDRILSMLENKVKVEPKAVEKNIAALSSVVVKSSKPTTIEKALKTMPVAKTETKKSAPVKKVAKKAPAKAKPVAKKKK